MHIVYVWQETKIPSSTSLLEKKNKPNKQNHDKTKQNKQPPAPPQNQVLILWDASFF